MEFKIGDKIKVIPYEELPEKRKSKGVARACGREGVIIDKLYSSKENRHIYRVQLETFNAPSSIDFTDDMLRFAGGGYYPYAENDEQSTDDDWRNELAEELGELADEQSNEELDETDSSTDEQDGDEDLEQEEKPIIEGKQKPTQKKPEKGIKDRKRKEQSTASLFDLLEPQEKSREAQMIERQLKGGSGFQHSKFRIFDKYNENPSTNAFADFLEKEYEIGGYSRRDGDNQTHNAKGIKMSLRGEQGETLEEKFLKWPEVAVRIADLIDDDNYLTEQEKKDYIEYKVEQNRLRAPVLLR